ncbi:MAG TPA: DinB family protein [Candidatus Limnocylindrales bacterium]|nr:DinB family protein [Candidatus Limnocylindrales bacterium]
MPYAWVDEVEPAAPDIVAAWRGIEEGRSIELRRMIRSKAGFGTAERTSAQLAVLAAALGDLLTDLPDALLREPGGEADWNVAETVGHVSDARAGLALAAAKAAAGAWPSDAPSVVPGIAGSPDADRAALLHGIARSQRIIERSARTVVGHETEPCPLEHPLVGRLRCGEWLLFAGVHDLMHLEQLHGLAEGAR